MANKTSDAERIRLHLRTILAQLTAPRREPNDSA